VVTQKNYGRETLKRNCENRNVGGRSALAANKFYYMKCLVTHHCMPNKISRAVYSTSYFTTFGAGAVGTATACGLANSEASSFGLTTTFSITIFSVG
jgi:hypothetical protein